MAGFVRNTHTGASLSCTLTCGRFLGHLLCIVRDRFGNFWRPADLQEWLNSWIGAYVAADPPPEARARPPLRSARIEISPLPGSPGRRLLRAWLLPFLPEGTEPIAEPIAPEAEIPAPR